MVRLREIVRRLHEEEAGFTLTELIMASVLMIIVLSATLLSLQTFETNSRLNRLQNEAQDEARLGQDRMARELRNLASPDLFGQSAVLRAQPLDLVFQVLGNSGSTARSRYCLGSNGRVLRQTEPSGAGDTTATANPSNLCPDPAWLPSTGMVVADSVVNDRTSPPRPIWRYNGGPDDASTPAVDESLTSITRIRSEIFIDVTAEGKNPTESTLASSVFLRNQNRVPIGTFTLTRTPSPNTVLFDASPSTDPEGNTLDFQWEVGSPPTNFDGVSFQSSAFAGGETVQLTVNDGVVSDTACAIVPAGVTTVTSTEC